MIAYPFHLILLVRRLALAVLIVTLAGITGARAELRLDITRGRVEPMPIAISTFYGQGGQENQVGRDIAQVVSANLERSGLFRPLDPKALIQDPASCTTSPDLPTSRSSTPRRWSAERSRRRPMGACGWNFACGM